MSPEQLPAAVVLAAGASTRMGRPKQLLGLGDGRTLLEAVVAAVCAASVGDVVVVLGHRASEIADRVRLGRARTVVAADHAEGMAASLRAGFALLDPAVERALIVLGDQADVSTALLDALLSLHAGSGRAAAATRVGGVLQPPVVVGRDLVPALLRLHGDTGLRELLRSQPDLVAALDVPVAVDLDTEAEYRSFLEARAAAADTQGSHA